MREIDNNKISHWLRCPKCHGKTKIKITEDTVLLNFPLFCPVCNTSINRILKNPIYTGVLRNGNAQSEVIPELQIIDQDTFDRAQRLMKART